MPALPFATLQYRSGGEVVTIVMLPDGRAGEVTDIVGLNVLARPWDQSNSRMYGMSEIHPWEETAQDLGLEAV